MLLLVIGGWLSLASAFAGETDCAGDGFHRIDLGVFLLEIETCLWASLLTFHDRAKNHLEIGEPKILKLGLPFSSPGWYWWISFSPAFRNFLKSISDSTRRHKNSLYQDAVRQSRGLRVEKTPTSFFEQLVYLYTGFCLFHGNYCILRGRETK